jgi:short-subunit dehydrogenase
VLRKQRSGHIVTITSTGGIVGQEFCSTYSASKFGLELQAANFAQMIVCGRR